MVGVFRNENLGDSCLGRNPAFDQPCGSRSLNDDILAGSAAILRTANNQNPELGRNDVELLTDVLAYPMQIMTTAWTDMVIDIDGHFDAWQVNWKRASIRSPFDDARLAQIG